MELYTHFRRPVSFLIRNVKSRNIYFRFVATKVNLLNGAAEISSHMGQAVCHINLRFDEKKIVINSFTVSCYNITGNILYLIDNSSQIRLEM
uniref:Uncharacterized protein n=1 Tax=Heterorhabditis bacteriophora TaxID=37862 RepID=A0A1I7WTJ3_HETBA